MKALQYTQRQNCSPGSLVYGNIFVRIFAQVSNNEQKGGWKWQFSMSLVSLFSELLKIRLNLSQKLTRKLSSMDS